MTNEVRSVADGIAMTLSAGRFDLDDEKACQAQIDSWLGCRVPRVVEREYRLSDADIPDFFIEGVVVEVKMNSARRPAVLAQLERYARHDQVTDLILVTNRALNLPATISGKPVRTVSLGRAWL
jgi:hypothetical protein